MKKISIQYAPMFVRMYKGYGAKEKEEIKEKISLFENPHNHEMLKVHKLKGKEGRYSFSVNYRLRIIFQYADNHTVNLLVIGTHDEVY